MKGFFAIRCAFWRIEADVDALEAEGDVIPDVVLVSPVVLVETPSAALATPAVTPGPLPKASLLPMPPGALKPV